MSSVSSISSRRPVLILVHGATGNGQMWNPVRRILAARFQVLTPDLPGHGDRRGETFTLEAAVATIVDLARSVAPAPVVLGGDSLGGYVSMAAAGALPADQLRGLVLGGCTTNFEGGALWLLRLRSALHRTLLAVPGERFLLGERFVKAMGKVGVGADDARAVLARGVNIAAFPDCVRALAHVDFAAKAAAIRAPILFVNGSKDRDMMRQQARFLAAAPGARSHVFEGVEHGVSLRRSADFAALVERFADQASP
jgi:pimeloyl-ACP methyl ester carboxylesterase